MHDVSLRTTLRQHTADIHARLDSIAGDLGSVARYRAFLVGSYRFRSIVEPALDAAEFWPMLPLLPHLARDLEDLGITPPAAAPPIHLPTSSAQLGALYVLEGSALGARLLQRRAAALGFDARCGARHLARQVADPARWPRFLRLLETSPGVDRIAALAAAQAAFERALDSYAEDHRERV